jgi:hypothetical protein
MLFGVSIYADRLNAKDRGGHRKIDVVVWQQLQPENIVEYHFWTKNTTT